MLNSDTSQGVYAPLCQTMSDSESEEELLHRNHQHARLQPKSTNAVRTASNLTRIENHLMFSTTEILGNYTNVTGNEYERTNGTSTWTNTVTKEGMSGSRKVLFFLSIGLCVFVIVGFLWLLPCSDTATCSSGEKGAKTHNWLRDYEKIELKGVINTAAGLKGRGKNLIFMYRSDRVFVEFDEGEHHTNGIISLIGRGGQVGWYDEMPEEPKSIDCSLVDVNKNGQPDCLVVGQMGQLGALDPISGEWLWSWRAGNASKIPEDSVDFPLILPDLNGDGVKDLLQIGLSEGNQHNGLTLISGATGRILGKSYTVAECECIHRLAIDRDFRITLSCWRNESSVAFSKSLEDLYQMWTNTPLRAEILTKPETIEQHRLLGQRKNTENQYNIYPVGGKELIVENRGKCPHHCNMTVRLIDEKHNHELLIRNGSGVYGMVPTSLSLNSSRSAVSGFIMKFWEWTPASGEFFESRRRREFPEVVRNHTHSPLEPILRMRVLREVVLMILFNATDTRVINTSQNNIVQFCLEEHGEEIFCQPDLNYQENSLLIADLDDDGSQELISYYTTFISSDNEKENWRLITYVQLLRLESELAKLSDFEGVN
ncbi:uncharacterized protein LOC129793097 [Lutzomyia longipalpis]|uniref:Putative conserved plasma membrane protein n=1 Tax=Lutzomyia longipalpis TaxID=7200 RepID=A0A7G3AC93_LUTLO|nr:uncharacterized protein LOC129793097 [Lutzomyia longipalpis]